MSLLGFLKKKKKQDDSEEKATGPDLSAMMSQVDTSQMSTMQKMAFKMFQKMSPEKQQEVMRKAMNPQNVQKEKAKILKQIDEMVKNGQIDKGQAEAVKSQMGLR